ncbi:MAG TPA: carboxypeptidase-like regulatory domain-containing protein [Kofleriaceae bacterium]|nr:carboxypeptidase-like regulatory domain-containing protein [Kofleriaceae bacterium]
MPAFDRKARSSLIAAVAAIGVVAWLVVRDRSHHGATGSATDGATAGNGPSPAADPWAAGDRADKTGRRRAETPGLRMQHPGPPVQVTGVVRLAGSGTAVAGAEVAFMNESGESTATADGSGRYTIAVASGVRWKVHARTDEAVGYPEPFEATGAQAVRDLEIQPLATVRGQVIDDQGAPVAGADVNIEVEGSARNLLESAIPLSTQSDGGGRFELRALAGGVKVRAARGMTQGLATIASMPPSGIVDVVVRIVAPVRLRGTVVDREDRPQVGATIKALAALEPGVYERKQVDAADDGSFDVQLPAGWVRLEASTRAGERAPVWNQSLVAGSSVDDVKLVVGEGELLRGRVTTADGEPVVGARVRLVAASTFDAVTSGDGHFEVSVPERVPYLVKVHHSDGYVQRQVNAWGDDEAFVMPRFGNLVVKVVGAGGDAHLELDRFRPAGEQLLRAPEETTFHGSADAIRADDLEPGHYWLTVSAPGTRMLSTEVEVPPAGTAELSVDFATGKVGALEPSGRSREARPC